MEKTPKPPSTIEFGTDPEGVTKSLPSTRIVVESHRLKGAPRAVGDRPSKPRKLIARSAVARQAETEAWALVGEGKMEAKDIPDFIQARERQARAMKTAALSIVPNMNRQQRRALAAQARKVKS